MAPRGEKRKRVASAARVAAKKVAAADAPTIEKEEVAEQEPKRRRLRARTTDEDVRKCERDNFGSYSYADLHHNLVGGQSLHNRLQSDVHDRWRNNAGAQVMGKAYYETLRKKWVPSACVLASDLVVVDLAGPFDAGLDEALEGVVSHRKNFSQLLEWFDSGKAPNQKVTAFLAKAMVLYVKPNTPERVDVVLAHMKWSAKHKVPDLFQKETRALHHLWVQACIRSLATYKLNGVTTNRWWTEFKHIGALLAGGPACQKCMDNKTTNWADLEEELISVVTANDFGYALFAKQAQSIFKRRLSSVAAAVVQQKWKGKGSARRPSRRRRRASTASSRHWVPVATQPFPLGRRLFRIAARRSLSRWSATTTSGRLMCRPL